MKKEFNFFILFFICIASIHAQVNAPFRSYLTQSYNAALNENDPSYNDRKAKIEEFIATNSYTSLETIEIPLFIHVLYKDGFSEANSEEMHRQLSTINEIFQGKNFIQKDSVNIHQQPFLTLKADVNIQFCLEEQNIFYKSTETDFSTDWWQVMQTESGGSDPINPDQQINIYIVDMGESTAGLAKYPWTNTMYNGVILNAQFLEGKHTSMAFQSGKTLAHLLASYLGLHELWNEKFPCSDDYVDDTPAHYAPSNMVLPMNANIISFCDPKGGKAMTINFMDNTEDAGLHIFTEGQKKRLRAMLSEGGPLFKLTTASCGQTNASNRNNQTEWVKLKPNPANTAFTLSYFSTYEGLSHIQFTNNAGVVVKNDSPVVKKGLNEITYNIDHLPKGYYIIKILGTNNQFLYSKLIIQ